MRSVGVLVGVALLSCRSAKTVEDRSSEKEGSDVSTSAPPEKSVSLHEEVRRQLTAHRNSKYSHKTLVDEGGGRFEYDCSGLVAYALRGVAPAALDEIPRTAIRPVARDYHDFFLRDARSARWWQPVARASDLAAGDLVVWLEPEDANSSNTGHIVVVDGGPMPGPERDEVTVVVIDSARSGHGNNDSRSKGEGGIGRGPVVLAVDADGSPRGFRWSPDAKSKRHVVSIAMGRLKR